MTQGAPIRIILGNGYIEAEEKRMVPLLVGVSEHGDQCSKKTTLKWGVGSRFRDDCLRGSFMLVVSS